MRGGSDGSVPDRADATPAAAPGGGAARWADLRLRVISATVLLPVGIGCLWCGGWAWLALVAATSVGLALEFVSVCKIADVASSQLALPVSAVAASLLAFVGLAWIGLVALAIVAAAVWHLGGKIVPALGVAYVGLTAVSLVWLRGGSDAGAANVLFVLLIVWATDIAAYAVGRLVGGRRLAPAISPGKTVSGAIGGLAGALLIGWIAAAAFGGGAMPGSLVLLETAALSIVAQAGDLLESWIKRRYGVKDSGHLIPGHGGLLDRLDGVLTAAPLAALLALFAEPGVRFWQ
jgi:phosphatidate cytidylyltransferase